MRNLSYLAKRDLIALDYMMNEHPNRDQLFGQDPTWTLDINDDLREALSKSKDSE